MVQKERGRDERENDTTRGKRDDAPEKAPVVARTEADAINDAHKKATKGRPSDRGLEDNPYEHG
jgi:hypothetical protein